VTGISRKADGHGVTHTDPRTDGDIRERGIEYAEILLAPFLENCSGLGDDLEKLAKLAEAGIPIAVAKRRVEVLLRSAAIQSLAWRLFDAHMVEPNLDEERVREIILNH
jgi:hypothetical protein